MTAFVERCRGRSARYPSDWAVLFDDGVHALRQGIEKAGTVDTEAVKDSPKGLEIDPNCGHVLLRDIDNQ
jgi:hypothetical protein